MNKSFSLYLDALRFLAAVLVVVSHWAYPRFTGGDYIIIRELNLGSDAVIFFFALSGLVISYTTDVKDKTAAQFAWNRITRLYSVVLLAIPLTLLFDAMGLALAPDTYGGWWYNGAPLWQKIAYGFSFSNEWFFGGFRIGTNGPYWSLSYEAMYYLIFAVVVFAPKKWLPYILIPLLLIAGLNVLLLFPAWLVGGYVYKRMKQDTPLSLRAALGFTVIPVILYGLALWVRVPDYLLFITIKLIGVEQVTSLRFSNEFLWNNLIAVLIGYHLWGAYCLSRFFTPAAIKDQTGTLIRWCAGASFTIYVVHYPAMQFLNAALPADMAVLVRHALLLSLSLVICFIVAEFCERRLSLFRNYLKAALRLRLP